MKPDLATLRDLATRLERAMGPDRDLNARIDAAFCNHGMARPSASKPGFVVVRYENSTGTHRASDYTGSLDAVATLHERLLPGWSWQLRVNCTRDGDETYANAQVWQPCDPRDDDRQIYWASGPDTQPALAWLRAIVAALIAQAEGRDGAA